LKTANTVVSSPKTPKRDRLPKLPKQQDEKDVFKIRFSEVTDTTAASEESPTIQNIQRSNT